jgi:hypothetical protein
MTTDYAKIMADPVRGPEIGRLYLDASPFITTLARFAYDEFARTVEAQFADLTSHYGYGLKVEFQEEDPYADAQEMFKDVADNRRLKVYATPEDQAHPLLGRHANDMFRAVHDFHGHYMSGRDFSRHGEEAAWVRHSQMFSGLARRAMTTETRGQSSALCWITSPEFPPQKAVLLPDWVSDIPTQWSSHDQL